MYIIEIVQSYFFVKNVNVIFQIIIQLLMINKLLLSLFYLRYNMKLYSSAHY